MPWFRHGRGAQWVVGRSQSGHSIQVPEKLVPLTTEEEKKQVKDYVCTDFQGTISIGSHRDRTQKMGTFYSTLIEHQLHADYCTERHKPITVTCIAGRTLRGESIRSSLVSTPWVMAATLIPDRSQREAGGLRRNRSSYLRGAEGSLQVDVFMCVWVRGESTTGIFHTEISKHLFQDLLNSYSQLIKGEPKALRGVLICCLRHTIHGRVRNDIQDAWSPKLLTNHSDGHVKTYKFRKEFSM